MSATQWQELSRQWPPYMNRKQVADASGGVVAAQTLANKDSKGIGIGGKRVIGKRVCYPKHEVLTWLETFTGEVRASAEV